MYCVDNLAEMESDELYDLLGISKGIPDDMIEWDDVISNFFSMRWEQMTETDREYYTAEAREYCGEGGVYQPV